MKKKKLKIENLEQDSHINLRIPKDMKRELLRIAKRENVGMSTLIRNSLWSMIFAAR